MRWALLCLLGLLLLPLAFAQSFTLTTYYTGYTHPGFQDIPVIMDINVSTNESNVYYSDNANKINPPYMLFDMSNKTGKINFTPTNDDVGVSPWITIIVQNRSNPIDSLHFQIRFNISNVNDPPSIVAAFPGNVAIPENSTLKLNVSVFDPDIQYGDILTYNWTLNGNMSPNLSFIGNNATYAVGLNQGDVGAQTITVIVTDSGGANVSHSWTITVVNKNIAPVFSGTIGNFSMDEDIPLLNAIVLNDYFTDDDVNASNHDFDTGIQLQFSLACDDDDEEKLNASFIHKNGTASFFPVLNWYGNKTCWFEVFDGFDHAHSNNFSVEVRPINDPPIIYPIPHQYTYANADFIYQVNASDVENDTLRFFSDSPIFQIDLWTGLINGSPGSGDVGIISVNISVDDGELNSSIIFNISVLPNEIPLIFDVDNQSVLEDSIIFINVSAWDPLGDNLSFHHDFLWFGDGVRYNDSLITYNFTPDSQFFVGNHTIRIIVDDAIGRTNFTEFNLEVRDLQKQPDLTFIDDYIVRVNKTFMLRITASDLDGNIHQFSTNDSRMIAITNSTGDYVVDAVGTLFFTPDTIGGPIAFHITVNDTYGYSDDQVFRVTVNPNSAPVITDLFNITCEENKICSGTFSGFDPDWQDVPYWSANDSLINLQPDGSFSFTPLVRLLREVQVNFTDGDIVFTTNIVVNITDIDDPPFFYPALVNVTGFHDITQDIPVSFNISAFDEENATCDFFIVFLNFTDLKGDTFYTGIDLFDIINLGNVSINETVGWINFTPNRSQTGMYWVNISAFDGVNIASTIFSFRVRNVNNPPSAVWIAHYTNYSTSDSTLPVRENSTLQFDITASDPDYQNLTLRWYKTNQIGSSLLSEQLHTSLRGSAYLVEVNTSFIYPISYNDAPYTNLTLSVVDTENVSTNYTWQLEAENVNRLHWFGQIRDSVFSGLRYENVTNSSSIRLAHSGTYALSGVYGSRTFDIGESNVDYTRFTFTNIDYQATVPAGTSITFQTRTREFGTLIFSDWEDVGPEQEVVSPSTQYIQYRAILTSNGLSTPTLHSVAIGYRLADITGTVGTILDGFLDLPDFFRDHDIDDNFTYQAYTESLEYFISASVSPTHKVRIAFNNEGIENLNFSCTDQDGNIVWSNSVIVNIVPELGDDDAPDQILVPLPTSGGGTTIQYRTRFQTRLEYVSLDIIHPGNVTFFEDDTMMVPVTIRNNGNGTLYNLNLSATAEHDFEVFLSTDRIDEILEGEEVTLFLSANLTDIYESFQILVRVDVEDPSYTDTAKITINSLKRGRANEEAFQVKYAFAMDLLQHNPICQELSEFLEKARELFVADDDIGGMNTLDNIIDDCRYMISARSSIESPSQVSATDAMVHKVKTDKSVRYALFLVGFVVLFGAGFGAFLKYKNL